jgi:hypothetical protein
MIAYFVGSTTGWIAVILTAFEIALPYLLRLVSLGHTLSQPQNQSSTYLERMWPHYWVGYLLAALSLTHASAVMGGPAGRANAEGLWAATGALLLLFLQVLLGLYLQSGGAPRRRLVLRCHFWVMTTFAALLTLHLGLNAR